MSTERERLYSVREASELPWLGLAYWTLWNYLRTGKVQRTKVGGKTMIRESELAKLIVDESPKPAA